MRSIALDEGIDIDPGWKTKITGFKLPFVATGVGWEREPRSLHRREIAARIERAIGQLAVEDFVTPPPVRYAKGVGLVQFSHFICPRPDRVVLNTRVQASDGTRVVICLFGTLDNVAGFVGPYDRHADGWTFSAMWSIVDWLASECTVNGSQWDDPESISIEAMKIATSQGANRVSYANPEQPWTRGFTFGDVSESSWFADIYSDVVIDRTRWDDVGVDRILVGAPLWIRSSDATVRRYRDYRTSR